jgi:hypothetical protein
MEKQPSFKTTASSRWVRQSTRQRSGSYPWIKLVMRSCWWMQQVVGVGMRRRLSPIGRQQKATSRWERRRRDGWHSRDIMMKYWPRLEGISYGEHRSIRCTQCIYSFLLPDPAFSFLPSLQRIFIYKRTHGPYPSSLRPNFLTYSYIAIGITQNTYHQQPAPQSFPRTPIRIYHIPLSRLQRQR